MPCCNFKRFADRPSSQREWLWAIRSHPVWRQGYRLCVLPSLPTSSFTEKATSGTPTSLLRMLKWPAQLSQRSQSVILIACPALTENDPRIGQRLLTYLMLQRTSFTGGSATTLP